MLSQKVSISSFTKRLATLPVSAARTMTIKIARVPTLGGTGEHTLACVASG